MSIFRRAFAWFFGCGYYGRATVEGREYIEVTGARCTLPALHDGAHRPPANVIWRVAARKPEGKGG